MVKQYNKMSDFFAKVYLWMFIGLAISGGVAYYTSISKTMLTFVNSSFLLIIIIELAVVIGFTALKNKVSPLVAKILFILYSAISGLTLSSIFLVYKIGSIGTVFLASAIMFGLLALYGFLTKQDLSSFGKLLIFGLIAVVIMSLINMFVKSNNFSIAISVISIVIFLGLTAWDMQSLKRIYYYYENNDDELNKASIYGALDLYLDFINIFLHLLQLFGSRKD